MAFCVCKQAHLCHTEYIPSASFSTFEAKFKQFQVVVVVRPTLAASSVTQFLPFKYGKELFTPL